MKYQAIIKDVSLQYGGDTVIVCFSRHEAVQTARRECLAGRAIGIVCYGSVLPKIRPIRDFRRLGWLE